MLESEIFEYVTFALIYSIAFTRYSNEADGMLFGLLLIGIVIISYMKKYGAIFITTIFAIILNIFALTRMFWFSVPWWVYLLAVGALLITFAIRNEVAEQKSSLNIGEAFKKIKDKIDN